MTVSQITALAGKYIAKLQRKGIKAKKSEAPIIPTAADALAHASYLCSKIESSVSNSADFDGGSGMNPEKAQRILGFVQGVLWMTGQRTLSQLQDDERIMA